MSCPDELNQAKHEIGRLEAVVAEYRLLVGAQEGMLESLRMGVRPSSAMRSEVRRAERGLQVLGEIPAPP